MLPHTLGALAWRFPAWIERLGEAMGGDPAEIAAALCARTGADAAGRARRRRGGARRVRRRRRRAAGAGPHAPARRTARSCARSTATRCKRHRTSRYGRAVEGERQPAPETRAAPPRSTRRRRWRPPSARRSAPAWGPPIGGLTTPAAVLALQRSAGNAAVTRALLARDEAKTEEKTKVTGAGDFLPSGGEPQGEGVTTVTKDPGDATKARALAPKVTMPASVKLKPGKTLGKRPASTATSRTSPPPRAAAPTARAATRRARSSASTARGAPTAATPPATPPTTRRSTRARPSPFYWPPVPIDDNAENVAVETKDGHARPARVQDADRERGRAADELRGPGQLPARGGRQDQLRGLQVQRVHVVGQLGRRGRQGDERRRRGADEGQGQARARAPTRR